MVPDEEGKVDDSMVSRGTYKEIFSFLELGSETHGSVVVTDSASVSSPLHSPKDKALSHGKPSFTDGVLSFIFIMQYFITNRLLVVSNGKSTKQSVFCHLGSTVHDMLIF